MVAYGHIWSPLVTSPLVTSAADGPWIECPLPRMWGRHRHPPPPAPQVMGTAPALPAAQRLAAFEAGWNNVWNGQAQQGFW